eukprot:3398032-Pyramimonas_sp.AAC.1
MAAPRHEARHLPSSPKTFSLDMARRSRDDLSHLGLSLLRRNRVGHRLRPRRSCWSGLPTPLKFLP